MQQKTGLELLSDYVFLSKYSQRKEDGVLESWDETLDRIYTMHEIKLKSLNLYTEKTKDLLARSKKAESQKRMLSSQRARQFASNHNNSGILKHETKIYNCTGTLIDRVSVFSEVMYLLLSGCGVGYSLHKPFVDKLPQVIPFDGATASFQIPDSIEGWADSIDALVVNAFRGLTTNFDYSLIRPQGSLIDNKFSAPGPEPLKKAHQNILNVFQHAGGRKLKTIEVHDILCFIAEAVVSGGVRRSAMISLFDRDDEDMLKSKTGSWWENNPQRAMANNSIITTFDEPLSYQELKNLTQVIRQFGEPGFVRVPDYSYCVNPCGEILLHPVIEGKTGFAFCNLVEINAEIIKSEEEFYELCELASFMGTVQSLYTNFKYLQKTTQEIAERDRAIGVSLTGVIANPLLRWNVLRNGAECIKRVNLEVSRDFGINPSKACTTVKPSGNSSCLLKLMHSGIHPAHATEYIRRVRVLKTSKEYQALKGTPLIKDISHDNAQIQFPIINTLEHPVTKDSITAIDHLKFIAHVKHFWINKGAQTWNVANNVSATVEVEDDEWNQVAAVIFANDHLFGGVSFLPKMGDTIYESAPFQRISTPELREEFNQMLDYINNNDIDFIKILSDKEAINAGDLAAIACNGNSCELK